MARDLPRQRLGAGLPVAAGRVVAGGANRHPAVRLPGADAADGSDNEDGEKKKKKRKGGVAVPEEWPWEEAKKIFEKPDVKPASEIEVRRRRRLRSSNCLKALRKYRKAEWKSPDVEGLVDFLVKDKGFK